MSVSAKRKSWRWALLGPAFAILVIAFPKINAHIAQERCDSLAGHPFEAGSRFAPVAADKLSAASEPACREAFKNDRTATNALHLGRILALTGADGAKKEEGFQLVKAAYEAGYLPAGASLATLHENGFGTPVDLPMARKITEEVLAKKPPFAKQFSLYRGQLLLRFEDADVRAEGLKVLSEAVPEHPELSLDLGGYYAPNFSNLDEQRAAEAWFTKAVQDGVAVGNLRLGQLYADRRSPLASDTKAYRALEKAAADGVEDGWMYAELARRTYFASGTGKNVTKSMEWAQLGSDAGSGYASYLAGAMLYLDDGYPNDSMRAEQYLERAIQQGEEKIAREFLPDVSDRAAAIRRIPDGKIATNYCIRRETSSADQNVDYFYNSCGRPIIAYVCSSRVAIDIWAALNGRDPNATCDLKKIDTGGMMDMYYGADENSSWLRSAIANSTMNWATCSWPFVPVAAEKGAYTCREQ